MKVAILGGKLNKENYQKVDETLNRLIEEKGIYLFYILCGSRSKNLRPNPTLGSIWAENNGAPVWRIYAATPAKLIDYMIYEADYIIFLLNPPNQLIKNALMKYKMKGKHGTIIK